MSSSTLPPSTNNQTNPASLEPLSKPEQPQANVALSEPSNSTTKKFDQNKKQTKIYRIRHFIFEYFLSNKKNRRELKWWTTLFFEFVIFGLSIVNIITLVVDQNSHIRDFFLLPYYIFLIIFYFVDFLFKWSFSDFYFRNSRRKPLRWYRPYVRYMLSPIWLINLIVWLVPLVLIITNWNNPSIRKIIVPLFLLTKSILIFNLLVILSKEYQNYQILIGIIRRSAKAIFFIIVFMAILTMIFAVFVYNLGIIGTPVDDNKVATINSFFDAYWMSFLTITTIGYGDVVPITYSGRIVVMILSILGIAFYSFLTSIIVNAFTKYLDAARANREKILAEQNKNLFKKYKEEIEKQMDALKKDLHTRPGESSEVKPLDVDGGEIIKSELVQNIIKNLQKKESKIKTRDWKALIPRERLLKKVSIKKNNNKTAKKLGTKNNE